MKQFVIFSASALAVMTNGCGGSAKYAASKSYEPLPEAEESSPPWGAAGDAAASAPGDYAAAAPEEGYAFKDDAVVSHYSAPPAKAARTSTQGSIGTTSGHPSPPPKQPNKPDVTPEGTEEPMVMYTGFLRLRVKRLLEAADEITRITEEMGGYIESLTKRVIVVRIPKGDFEAAMNAFREVGELLDRRIQALDVTEQFTDLQGRLAVAKEARERLLKLLETVKDVEERLRIMQEIKRLTEQIETIESRLKTLQNLVDYFTITIELQPVLEDTGAQLQQSPFYWIRSLLAHSTTIYEGKDEISMKLPSSFVLFEQDDAYRAQAADTTIIRAGVVDNEPRGDNAFWSDAVHHEMEGRGETLVEAQKAGKLVYRLYRSEDVTPRFYLIAVHAVEEDVYVVEVFFPNEESKTEHLSDVIQALKTFEVTP